MSMAYFAEPDGSSSVPFAIGRPPAVPAGGLPLVLATMRDLSLPTASGVARRAGLSERQVRRQLARARNCGHVAVVRTLMGGTFVYALTTAGLQVARGE